MSETLKLLYKTSLTPPPPLPLHHSLTTRQLVVKEACPLMNSQGRWERFKNVVKKFCRYMIELHFDADFKGPVCKILKGTIKYICVF